ncbi:hypothetical protein [Gloeothece verrucosa]|uniref:Uncharacterized protein n=1 Tax=Gloeothece verrucosa (strain PCC 7822) TaxID=497965 RepID=E0UNK8_GLOV7|nr:hypothetical protein [Gloeothece verrucosa]ADN18538.1 hypothetical protein Cyan7822_6894 [Gloeothece verrucosa PCC 7822]
MSNNPEINPVGLDIYFPFLDLMKAANLVERYGQIVMSGYSDNYTNIVLQLKDSSKKEEIKNRLLTSALAVFNFPHGREDKLKLYQLQTGIDLIPLLEKLEQVQTFEELKTITEEYPSEHIDECWMIFDDNTLKKLNSLAQYLF